MGVVHRPWVGSAVGDEKPEFVVNRDEERDADALTELLGHVRRAMAEPADLAIATAPSSQGQVADELDHLRSIRLLLGAEPQVP